MCGGGSIFLDVRVTVVRQTFCVSRLMPRTARFAELFWSSHGRLKPGANDAEFGTRVKIQWILKRAILSPRLNVREPLKSYGMSSTVDWKDIMVIVDGAWKVGSDVFQPVFGS